MNEFEKLKIVHAERKPHWGGKNRYTYSDLRRDLGIESASADFIADSQFSSLFNERSSAAEGKLLRLLSGDDASQGQARQRIESSLELEGLFSCSTRSEVVELIRHRDGTLLPTPRLALERGPAKVEFGLTPIEQGAIKYLAEELVTRDKPLLHWDAPFNSGASIIARNLWSVSEIHQAYACVAVVRPSNLEVPFEAEISALRDHLAAQGRSTTSRAALADAVASAGMLLVVLSPFVLDSVNDNNSMRQLLREFASAGTDWVGPSRLLVVGRSDWALKSLPEDPEPHSDKLKRLLRLRGDERFSEFRAQWARFSELRGNTRSEESGSRMRRAATYYRRQNTEDLWPISIKLRALFASNETTAAYFDPTQGFARLAGPRFIHFADIASYHEDVSDYIDYVRFLNLTPARASKDRKRRYYLLQYVSTTKHWLTEDALQVLIAKIGNIRPNNLNLETEKTRMLALHPVVTEKAEVIEGKKRSRYFASIAIKAIVQDAWTKYDPYTRALAHYRMARRLKNNENDKQLLVWEFPYGPHWGRSRIFFLSETIRHLVRSSETYDAETRAPDVGLVQDFPHAPAPEKKGSDPYEVINYCYEVLYQAELNGNVNGAAGRALAKRYGAYQLAVELLELLSYRNEIGVPHPQLKSERRAEFMRECGFALLDIGNLASAKECFASAEKELDDNHGVDWVNAVLDSVLVDCIAGRLEDAHASLERARSAIEKLHQLYLQRDVLTNDYRLLRKVYRRLLARDAHWAYLAGDHERTLDQLDKIEDESRWSHTKEGDNYTRVILVPSFGQRLEAEQTHLLVAALHKRGAAEEHVGENSAASLALNRCLEAMLLAHSEGLNHQAMGFRIALARCFRRRGMLVTAETMLDAVHRDLLRYGCSERTFLAFLNEAGRVLHGLDDPIRAYATYLRPCVSRAKAHGFRRDAEQASAQAIDALLEVRRRCSENLAKEQSWVAVLDEAKAKHRSLVASVEEIAQDDLFGRDPLFAYAIADAERVIDDLDSCDAIDRHLSEIRKELGR
jgi:hypothetical protein